MSITQNLVSLQPPPSAGETAGIGAAPFRGGLVPPGFGVVATRPPQVLCRVTRIPPVLLLQVFAVSTLCRRIGPTRVLLLSRDRFRHGYDARLTGG